MDTITSPASIKEVLVRTSLLQSFIHCDNKFMTASTVRLGKGIWMSLIFYDDFLSSSDLAALSVAA